jgi:hypothetical protein
MIEIYYEDILVGASITNRSVSVDEFLMIIGFDEEDFCQRHNLDGLDYNEFKMVY